MKSAIRVHGCRGRKLLTLLVPAAIVCYAVTIISFSKYNFYETLKFSKFLKCAANKYHIQEENSSIFYIKTEDQCTFLQKIDSFSDAVNRFHAREIQSAENTHWKDTAPRNETKFLGSVDSGFFQMIQQFPEVKTLILSWSSPKSSGWSSLEDNSNVLIKKYYDWTGDDPFCKLIETSHPDFLNIVALYNRTCIREIEKTKRPISIPVVMFHYIPIYPYRYWPANRESYPRYYYYETPRHMYYIHLIRNAVVNTDSNVWAGKMKLVHMQCRYDWGATIPPNASQLPLYDEVMALSQFWGYTMYHRMIEILPRVSPYVTFLKANPQIKIFISEKSGRTAELLNILGLRSDRLISRNFRANHVYLPRGTLCGVANVQETQLLSKLYHDYIRKHFPAENRDKLVLIRRSHSRIFFEQLAIEKMVESVAKSFKLRYVMYIDNPAPSLNETMKMFYSAVMVVAPHGAGLSNLIFSQPGTSVIEGICNAPFSNLCYQNLAMVLGHRWHGIGGRAGCYDYVNVSTSSVQEAMLRYLKLMDFDS